jgi:acid stress-induced BolA-like protein IbaG/YrbA
MAVTERSNTRKSRGRSRAQVKAEIARALRAQFKDDTVDVSDGYKDNIHVVVVSRKFDKMSEKQKQQYVWDLIDASPLTAAEKSLISLVYPISPAEIK